MNHRHLVAAAVAASMSIAAFVAIAPPAAAGIPVAAHGDVEITYTSTTFTICATGGVDDGTGTAGTWELEIDGARSNGSDIHQALITFGEVFPLQCFAIPKNGTANGAFVTTLSFATAGSNSPNLVPDFVAVAGGEGEWNPNSSNSFGT